MGYNTIVLFLNDHLHSIKEDAQEVIDKIYSRGVSGMDDNKLEQYPSIKHHYYLPYQIQVPTVHHADETVLIAVGGNYATKLFHTWGYSHHEEKDQIRLLKEWANKLGYNISKKREKK